MFKFRTSESAGLKGVNWKNESPLRAVACTENSTEEPIEKQSWKAAVKHEHDYISLTDMLKAKDGAKGMMNNCKAEFKEHWRRNYAD